MAAKSEFYEIDTGVAEVLHEPDGSMVLLVNGVPSSHVVPGEPTRLDFEYMRWMADFLDSAYPETKRAKSRLTHLGGGEVAGEGARAAAEMREARLGPLCLRVGVVKEIGHPAHVLEIQPGRFAGDDV